LIFIKPYVLGQVSNICRYRYDQGAAHFCRRPVSIESIKFATLPLPHVMVAGVLILIVPRLLNYIVAAYLIVVGLLGLFGDIHLR
jgi:hypothetical protein